MLTPGIMHAFKLLRSGILDSLRRIKIVHRPQIREGYIPWAYDRPDNTTYCSIRFTASLSDGRIDIEDVQVTLIDHKADLMRPRNARADLCRRFLQELSARAANYQPGTGLIQLLIDYVQGMHELSSQNDYICRACGRRRTIQWRGACCGYMGQEVAPFFCDRKLAVKRGEAFDRDSVDALKYDVPTWCIAHRM